LPDTGNLPLFEEQQTSLTMRKLLVLVIVLSSVGASLAQVQVALGVKAGANISKFDDSEADNLTSFHAGAFALFKLTKIGIQPEVLFSQQGASVKSAGQNLDFKTAYMTIPVMVKVYLIGGLNVQAGPQFGFLTKAELDGTDLKESLKNSDISANLGLGWDLPFGLTVDARYNIGLSDVGDDAAVFDSAVKSRVIQVSLGYKIFKLGK
jgi:Outer membrane protein beta-barrel domain